MSDSFFVLFFSTTTTNQPRLLLPPIPLSFTKPGTCCGYPVDGYQRGGASTGASGGGAVSPNGWLFPICTREPRRCAVLDGYDKGNGFAAWFDGLFFNDARFAATAAARYRALRAGPWSDAAVTAMLASKRRELAGGVADRTLARWPGELGASGGVDAAVDAVTAWLLARLAWLDGAYRQADDAATRAAPYKEAY